MKYVMLVTGVLLFYLSSAQEDTVNVSVESSTNNELKILNTYPDLFPAISIIFKAEKSGNPVWDLDIEELSVYENNEECRLLSLESIAIRKAINIALVLDHSGSMETDYLQLYADGDFSRPLFNYDSNGSVKYPDGYETPLDKAKVSIRSFIKRFNLEKDYVSLIGFSTDVDIKIPLTNDTSLINAVIDTIKPTMSTALYDASCEGLIQLRGRDGVSVEVLLTDGHDNASSKTLKDVVSIANKEEIPLFVIGLGDVNVDTLALMAKETNGEFFYAYNAKSLDSIYTAISKKILSFYDLKYESTNVSSIDKNRQIRLEYKVSDEFLFDTTMVKLPEEVVIYLQAKEKQKKYFVYGGIAVILLVLGGVLIARYNRKEDSEKIIIEKIYPNPSTLGVINVIHNSDDGFLVVRDLSGKELRRQKIKAKHETVDLFDYNGTCVVMIETEKETSMPMKVIVLK